MHSRCYFSQTVGKISPFGPDGRRSSNFNTTRISQADLGAEIERLVDASVAENIKETYRTCLSVFDAFRSEYGLPSVWPPPVSHVTTFICP